MDPLVGDVGLPVDLEHAVLHPAEVLGILVPASCFVEFLEQQTLSTAHADGGQHVETLGCGALRGHVLVVHHLLQHLAVGHITLRHEVDLIPTGGQEFRYDACLLLRHLLNIFAHTLGQLFAGEDVRQARSRLLDLFVHLQDGDIVGHAHQIV